MIDEQQPASPDEQPASGRLTSQSIRSFVLRQGRMSDAQHRFLDEMMPKVGVAYRPEPVDLNAVFGRQAPHIVEIGFGMGQSTAVIAQARSDEDFLGIEVHAPGVGSLCKLIDEGGITNLRIVQHDAVEVLRDMIPQGSLAGVHIYFPDPWPKKRHHKNRLVRPDFLESLAARTVPGGRFYFRTDHAGYFADGREVLEQHPRWTIDPAAPWPFEEATVFQLKAPAYQSLVAVVR